MRQNGQQAQDEDPCPTRPTSFRTVESVAPIAEKPVLTLETMKTEKGRVIDKGPHRVLRTAVSSMASSDAFGKMMKREAERRRFDEAAQHAFIGDGLNWNRSV